MKNYCTETDLKSYFPELDLYRWSNEPDFSQFKSGAEMKVCLDLKNKGYDLRKLQTPLVLLNGNMTSSTTTDKAEDTTNRLRCVYTVSTRNGTTSFILQGSNTGDLNDNEWADIKNVSITVTGENSIVFSDAYKYYRAKCVLGGVSPALSIIIKLVETNYDILFIYKWLELIMMNGSKQQNDRYWLKMLYFKENYDAQLNSMVISIDENEDGSIADDEQTTTNIAEYIR